MRAGSERMSCEKTEVWRPLSRAAWVMNFLSSWRPVLHKTHSSPNLKFLLFGIKWCAEEAAFCITNRPQRQRQHKKTPASFTPADSASVLLHDGLLRQVTSGTKRGQGQNKANLSAHFGQRYKTSRGQQSDLAPHAGLPGWASAGPAAGVSASPPASEMAARVWQHVSWKQGRSSGSTFT